MTCFGIVSRGMGWHARALREALERRGVGVCLIEPAELVGRAGASAGADTAAAPRLTSRGVALDTLDAVLVRTLPGGSLEQVIFRVDALHRLEHLGVPVINPPAALERCVDKFYTSTLLEDAGLPTPPTVVSETAAVAMEAWREWGDVVVKPLFGSEGRGMVRVSDPDVAHRVFRAWEEIRAVYYVQRYIPHGGHDVRAFVIGGRVVAAMMRAAGDGEWKTNVSQGARATPFDLPAELADMSAAAAAAVGADYAGVDLLPGEDGRWYVLEVNAIPGWSGLQTTTPQDVAGAIADHALEVAAARRRAMCHARA